MSTGDLDHVSEWFTEDFQLHDPSFGGFVRLADVPLSAPNPAAPSTAAVKAGLRGLRN